MCYKQLKWKIRFVMFSRIFPVQSGREKRDYIGSVQGIGLSNKRIAHVIGIQSETDLENGLRDV